MDLRKSKYILPNLFTLASVFFGVLAMASCLEQTSDAYKRSAIAILIAMVADSLDGRVARMTRTATRFGIQLDSLADVLSFGMAPAILAYAFALRTLDPTGGLIGVTVAFVFAGCGAMRLARFNIQADNSKKPTSTFTGLPIPAAAGMICLMIWVAIDLEVPPAPVVAVLTASMVTLALLMVSTVPYPSFKHVHVGLGGRVVVLAIAAGVIVAAWKTHASAVLLGLGAVYVVLGPADWLLHLPAALLRRRRRRGEREADEPL